MNKRLLSLLLALLMLVSIVPTAAFAAVRGGDEIPAEAPAAEELPQSAAPAVVEAVPAELAADDTPDGNLCRPATCDPADNSTIVTATGSSEEIADFAASKAIDGVTHTETHNNTARWGSNTIASGDNEQSLVIDLGTPRTVSSVLTYWCGDNHVANAISYTISVATSSSGPWTVAKTVTNNYNIYAYRQSNDAAYAPVIDDFEPQTGVQYVKIQATAFRDTQYKSISFWEVEIYRDHQTPPLPETPDGNLCRPSDNASVTATARSVEGSHTADLAIDGDSTTRWTSSDGADSGSKTDEEWFQVDLGTLRTVGSVTLVWEKANAKAYTIQTKAAESDPWTTQVTRNSKPASTTDVISFSQQVAARYVRVHVTDYDPAANTWYNVALYEFEVYRDIPVNASTILTSLTADSFEIVDGKLALKSDVEIPDGFTVSFAANLEQVVGADHTVYTPLVNTVVDLDVTVTNDIDPTDTATTAANSPIRVTIPGAHTANEGNPKPAVIPEIMEWYSSAADQGMTFTLTENSRIIHRYGAQGGFDAVANELTADINDLFDLGMTTAKNHVHDKQTYADIAAAVQPGDIVIYNVLPTGVAYNRGLVAGFDNETYRMEISNTVTDANGNVTTQNGTHVTIFATDATGAYWATRTLLQALKLSQAANNGLTIDCGTIRDYPEFKVRGFVLDVGRKPMSMELLQNIVKNMSWYKLNDFHVHLSDNLIFMEDYGVTSGNVTDPEIYAKANDAYSAFRLESDIQEEPDAIAPLSAKDYHYTKDEFKQFIQDSSFMGVNIVPEIDVPAHAKPIVDAFPSLRLQGVWASNGHPANCHLDLSNKYNESLAKVQEIFDEYLNGNDPIFSGDIVHFGADEYFDGGSHYRKFAQDMIAYLRDKGYTPRLWGSLSHSSIASNDPDLQFDDKEQNKGVQMNIWNTGWANPQTMYDKGFDLINVTDGPFYMVPNGSGGRYGYGDYLNLTDVYNKAPNNIGDTWLPASSSQILGEAYAIWDDEMIDTRSTGLDEMDVFDRFYDTLPVIAVRQWGVGSNADGSDARDRTLTQVQADAAKIGLAPNSDPYYKVDETDHFSYDFTDATDKANDHDLTLTNAAVDPVRHLLVLNGGSSYVSTGLDRLGRGSQLTFKVFKLAGGEEEQVIFEGDHLAEGSAFPYNEFAIKALPVEGDDTKWKLGFSRELHDYEFNVELPVGEWVRLTLTNGKQATKLSVNGGAPVAAVGKLVSDETSNTPFRGKTGITNSSFAFPVARIGSKTNAFVGYVASVSSSEPIEVPDSFLTATAPSQHKLPPDTVGDASAAAAVDGDLTTYWHSNYGTADAAHGPNDLSDKDDQRYIQLNLATPVTVSALSYTPRSGAGNGTVTSYRIEVSTDGMTFTAVEGAAGDWARDDTTKTVTFSSPQNKVLAVRLYGVATSGDVANKFMNAAEVTLDYGETIALTDDNTEITLGEVTWGTDEATVEISVALKPSGLVLTKGTDYTVAYTNNTAAGEATVTITGMGVYTGTLTTEFTVPTKPAIRDLSTATITFPQESYPLVDGKAEPKPVVKLGSVTLLEGIDYTLSYIGNTLVGEATATVTGIGLYTGSASQTFQVTPEPGKKDLSNASRTKVVLHQLTFPYTGAAITPVPVVTYDGETLTEGTDYTVTYAHNSAIGTATVTVTGVAPSCEGSATASFRIIDPANAYDLSDPSKTVITLNPETYEYTGHAITPTFTVSYDGQSLVQGTDYTVELSHNIKGGTGVLVIHGAGEHYYGSFVATFTITGGGTSTNPGGSSSGGSSSGGTTATSKLPDGASMTTRTDDSGAMTATVTYPSGAKVTADIPVTGPVTAVVTVPAGKNAVTVTVPTRTPPTLGHVAVILRPDGTEEIVKTAMPNDFGLEVTLDANAVVQVVDNTRSFVDVPADSWAKDAITFVTSREIFNGTGNNTFSPSSDMSRAMVCTVLANLAGEDTTGGETWYEKAVAWAVTNQISDGTIPNAIITREQLAAMLYRYAGAPACETPLPDRFRDLGDVSDWAEQAMAWAVENDLLRGRSSLDGLDLAPKATATRAEVASVFQRYVALLK